MFAEKILMGADAVDARNAFDDKERAKYLNGSEALTCIRKQWYKKHKPDREDEQDWGFARRGSHAEVYMVDRLKAANVHMLFAGDDQVGIVDEDLRISVTPDGLAIIDGELWGAEFKSIDPRTNTSRLPKKEHVVQLQIGMAMFEKHRAEFPELGDMPIKGGRLVYINASNFNEIHEHHVDAAPGILDRLSGRANRVLDTKDASRLPREGKEQGGQECQQRCGFRDICGVDGAGSSTGQGHAGGGDIYVQVDAYITAKEDEDLAKGRKAAAAEKIKAVLTRDGINQMVVDGHAVTLQQRAGSVSYAKVVKDHCPDVDLEPYRGASTEILTVK
jgi:hypothetical protein